MGYIGPSPNPGQNREVDDISSGFNGGTASFTLQVNGQNVSPGSANAIVVSLGGVIQNPGTDYTVAASTITFTTNPASGLSFFGLVLGQGVDTQTIADGQSPTMAAPSITGDLSIADKIVHTGDTNTAIRFPAADTVSVETGGSERLRVDSSGNVGIGINNPTTLLHLFVNQQTAKFITLNGDDSRNNYIGINSGDNLEIAADEDDEGSSSSIRFRVDGTERFRILDNTTFRSTGHVSDTTAKGISLEESSVGGRLYVGRDNNDTVAEFHRSGSRVGTISVNASNTSYNTSSDYRLKENVTSISDGITRLKTLKPSRFNFKVDKDTTVDGFLAHEVTPAVPEAITGTKDETQDILYTEEDTIPSGKKVGDVKETVPIYQGIDQSKLVPLLTAALQEAVTKIETLETKVAALEAA